jgi:chromosome segregation ATPase
MESSSGTSIWVWVLGGIALAVAVLGLVIAVSANSSETDEKQVVKEAVAQVESELSGVGGAVAEDKKLSDEADRTATRDRRQIRRLVAVASRRDQEESDILKSQVGSLKAESTKLKGNVSNLRGEISELTTQTEDLEAQVEKLRTRLNSGGSG